MLVIFEEKHEQAGKNRVKYKANLSYFQKEQVSRQL